MDSALLHAYRLFPRVEAKSTDRRDASSKETSSNRFADVCFSGVKRA